MCKLCEMAENSKNSVMKLNEINYADWSMMMEAVLVRKQLWDVVNGEKTKPMGSENSSVVKSFIRKQAEARAELVLAVESSQLPHLRNADPSKIWEDLKNIHKARGFASRLALCRKFLWLSKGEEQPMQTWIAEVKHTRFHLTQIGVEVSDKDFILVLTQGLPAAYETFVVSLDATDPSLLTSEHVISRLLNEEARQSGLNHELQTTQKDAAFYTKESKTKHTLIEQITCFRCQKKGHYQAQCPENTKKPVNQALAAVEESAGVW